MVHGVEGEVAVTMDLVLRFNYGEAIPWVTRRDYGLSAVAGPDAVELHTRVDSGRPRHGDRRVVHGASKDDTVSFTLSYHPSHKQPHFVPDRGESLDNTISWWREWIGRCTFPKDNPAWYEAVTRSLITLKLLTFAADRRHGCGADDVSARTDRRFAQLGLSLSAGCAIHR